MGITKTLWDILDHQRQEPAILDSRDAGTSNHFAKARPFRWKVGVRAALVLVAGFLVVVVGANFMRSLAPPPEALPVAESSESPSAEVLENTYGHPTRGLSRSLRPRGPHRFGLMSEEL